MKQVWRKENLSYFVDDFLVPQRDKPKVFSGEIPWCRIEDFDGIYLAGSKSKQFVSEDTVKSMGLKIFPRNTVIVSCSADLGKCAITEKPLVTNQTFIGLVPSEKIEPLFLYYYMSSIADTLNQMASGATIKYLSKKKFQELEVVFPDILEQKRIASIINEAFTNISKAKENAEQNLKNARELFESHLHNIFTNKENNWEEKTLGEVCEDLFAGGDVDKNNMSRTKTDVFSIPIFTNGEKNKGLYGYTNIARVTKPSITISARGTIGYSEIREEAFYPAVRLIVVIPKLDIIILPFLKYVISGMDFTHSGSSIPQLTVPMVKNYLVNLPPIEQQQVIVKKLNELSSETKRLEAIYEQKLKDLEELKKSILQKAFNGEL